MTPTEAAALAWANTPAVKRHALSYLAHLPKLLDANGPDMAGQVAVALGNFLLWVAPSIDPGESQIESPMHETAQTLHALGKQFRVVGLKHWDKKHAARDATMRQLSMDLENLRDQVSRLQTEYVRAGAPDRREPL